MGKEVPSMKEDATAGVDDGAQTSLALVADFDLLQAKTGHLLCILHQQGLGELDGRWMGEAVPRFGWHGG